jgi:hypothetical protein
MEIYGNNLQKIVPLKHIQTLGLPMFHDRSSLSRLVALLEDFWWQWQLLLRQGRSGSGKSELQTPSESSSPSALAKRPAEADLQ